MYLRQTMKKLFFSLNLIYCPSNLFHVFRLLVNEIMQNDKYFNNVILITLKYSYMTRLVDISEMP